MSETLRDEIRKVIRAFDATPHEEKGEREYYAIRTLRLALNKSLAEQRVAVVTAQECFGAPGDWGYGTPEGDALADMYDALDTGKGGGE